MELIYQALPEMIATLIGVAVGGLGALYLDERRSLLEKRKRSQVILHNLKSELEDNFHQLADAKTAYEDTPYGKSLHQLDRVGGRHRGG